MPDETPAGGASAPTEPTRKKKSRWIDLLLILVGIGCLTVFGLQTLRYKRSQPKKPSGKTMAGLKDVDRIPVDPGAARDYNVFLVTLDTTRADHFGCYGNQNVATPNIDALARKGVLFEKALTSASSTLPGHSTILTGLYPYHHGARSNGTYKLQPEQVSVAEILKDAGYTTGAAIGAYVLDSRFGLDQGFDEYNDDLTKGVRHAEHMFRERPAEITNEFVLDWLDRNGKSKFFFWMHYFDAHQPYLPPEPFRSEYANQPYDGEYAYADAMLGHVLAKIDALGVRDKTIIVIAGDHGESLGEHGEVTHSLLIYDATMHTALIVNCPSLMQEGSIVHNQVSNVDIVPTLLDMLGIETQTRFDGVSLLKGRPARPDWIYGETIATLVLHGWAPLFSIRDEQYKYIHAPEPELYDTVADPNELNNLFTDAKYADQVARLSKELDAQLGEDKLGAEALEQAIQMDAATAEHLRGLGYVATTTADKVNTEQAWQLDPKKMIKGWDRIQEASNLKASGKTDEAIALLEEGVAEIPGDVFARRTLAGAYIQSGRFDEAEKMLKETYELEKSEPNIPADLATISLRRGNFAEARRYLDEAMQIDPNYALPYVTLGDIAAINRDWAGADANFRKAIELDPAQFGPQAYTKLGMMYLGLLRVEDAREAFEAALKIDALFGGAHAGMGSILAEEGRYDESLKSFETTLRFDPNQPVVLAALAGLYDKLGEFEKGKEAAEKALESQPNLSMALNNLALIMKHTGDMPRAVELFEKALSIEPNDLAARLNLALCYHGMQDDDRAAEEYEEVLRIQPHVPIALLNLGKYNESLGRFDKAFDLYNRAVMADPNYAMAHASLASALLKQGRVQEAHDHLKRAVELDANISGREQIESQLDALDELIKGGSDTKKPDENTDGGTNG